MTAGTSHQRCAATLLGPTLLGPTLLGPSLLGPTLLGPTLLGRTGPVSAGVQRHHVSVTLLAPFAA